ncbi:hypothetical protein N7495_007259 [Penicillium taxi]|uniref:uncharacterized protein n=1 Tax=Penicillium taxi TaxID=168475 RepID=UPI002545AA3C|nr:uncharacterized protein N7495_007259 [Penicillium taxi]KAJ5895568.1 hypothetical protein N7495_007259 [Penicillium taxi]
MAAGTTANGRSNRASASKKELNTLVVTLKLSPDLLQRFITKPLDTKTSSKTNPVKSQERSSPASSTGIPAVRPSSADNASDLDTTSTPATGANSSDTPRRKGVPGPKPGNKRTNAQTESSTPRSRGRPGPKKKTRLEEGAEVVPKVSAAHRLGPKANTGAINAGLRALDRTGAPCRKWERQSLKLRSFTGVAWKLPSWRTPSLVIVGSDEAKGAVALESIDSDNKHTLAPPGTETLNGSSAVPSEKSNSGGDITPAPSHMVEASSPAVTMVA